MSFHTVIIVGNLGRDPEMRYTPGGQAVTSFSVASTRQYTNSNSQQVKETIWFRVSVWGKMAETCNNYLKKGSKVLVEGRLVPGENGSPRIFTRGDGSSGSNFEINAQTVRFLSARGDVESSSEEMGDAGDDGDNIPF